MKNLDKNAFLVILVAGLLLSAVIFVGNQVPISITCQLPDQCAQVGPFGGILFAFSRPVRTNQVENLWQTHPHIEGDWTWIDNQHARWDAVKALPSDQKMTFQFVSGQAGQNGEQITNLAQWQALVRSPQIIVIRKTASGPELFALKLDGEASGIQLTHTNGRIYDYSVSPDGESIVFSVLNDQKGIDLWMVQRDGANQHKLLDCGKDQCSTPTWSPTTQELAYTRESAGLDSNGPMRVTRVWILDEQSGQTAMLFADPHQVGEGPMWSPDGQWISMWNSVQRGILVVNRKTGGTFFLESSNGDAGSWSEDSRFLYYSNMVSGQAGFRYVVLRADIRNRSISTIFGGNVEGGGLSVDHPICSPVEKWVAVTIQPDIQIPGKELLTLSPDSKDGLTITSDLSQTPVFYSWTPDGDHLIYQSNLLGGNGNDAEIWTWDRNTGKTKKITTGDRSPQWLP